MDEPRRRVVGILLGGAIEAYGVNPYAPMPDDPAAPCVTCEHRQDEHTGEEWEGPCGVKGCACAMFGATEPRHL